VDDQDADLTDTGILNAPRTTIFVDELLQLSGGASAMGTVAPVGNVTLEFQRQSVHVPTHRP